LSSGVVPSGVFNYGGSTTWVSIRTTVDPVIQSVWPQFRLRYTDPDRGAPSSQDRYQYVVGQSPAQGKRDRRPGF